MANVPDIPTPSEDLPDIIDVEEHVKAGKPVPRARRYRIRIDRVQYVVDHAELTGREILRLAGKTPEEYILSQKIRGGHVRTIEADDRINVAEPGVERFMTMKREAQEGYSPSRRLFKLPAGDESFLESRNQPWEAVLERSSQWVIVYNLILPSGYNVPSANVAVHIVAGYPDAPLDMAYFLPELARVDGKAIPQINPHDFDGKRWQRWSRHRTPANPWVPGEDSLATHMMYVETWLKDEFRKRP